ncbi:uncharacterized protein BKA78DRAFT_322813 [Phyllosticta capitalensis]|uniref:uncharacterized protein n=1 Tax=Phyllosticta capitalensis TaxID=121624 RepID=UPI00312F9739
MDGLSCFALTAAFCFLDLISSAALVCPSFLAFTEEEKGDLGGWFVFALLCFTF